MQPGKTRVKSLSTEISKKSSLHRTFKNDIASTKNLQQFSNLETKVNNQALP